MDNSVPAITHTYTFNIGDDEPVELTQEMMDTIIDAAYPLPDDFAQFCQEARVTPGGEKEDLFMTVSTVGENNTFYHRGAAIPEDEFAGLFTLGIHAVIRHALKTVDAHASTEQ